MGLANSSQSSSLLRKYTVDMVAAAAAIDPMLDKHSGQALVNAMSVPRNPFPDSRDDAKLFDALMSARDKHRLLHYYKEELTQNLNLKPLDQGT